jgi:hypothetical protein
VSRTDDSDFHLKEARMFTTAIFVGIVVLLAVILWAISRLK